MSKPRYIIIPELFSTDCCPNCERPLSEQYKYIVADMLKKPYYSEKLMYYYFNLTPGYAICGDCYRKVQLKRFLRHAVKYFLFGLALVALSASYVAFFQAGEFWCGIVLLLVTYGLISIAAKLELNIYKRTISDESNRKLSTALDVLRSHGWEQTIDTGHFLSAHYEEGDIKRDLDAAFGTNRYCLVDKKTGEIIDYTNNPEIFEEVFLHKFDDRD